MGSCLPWLHQRYHDITEEQAAEAGRDRRLRAPERQDVEDALAFAQTLWKGSGTRLLVHCHAGMSRSPAIAAACLAAWHSRSEGRNADRSSAEQIAGTIAAAARIMIPNPLILCHAEAAMPEWRGHLLPAMTEASERINECFRKPEDGSGVMIW